MTSATAAGTPDPGGNADPTLITAITPELQELVDAARQWAATIPGGPDAWSGDTRALLDAVRALEPLAPDLPPEPGRDAVRRDRTGDYWRRKPEGWRPMLTALPPTSSIPKIVLTWEDLDAKYGPLVELRPATETFPADVARELTEALRTLADVALRADAIAQGGYDRRMRLIAQAEPYLARAEAALTDTPATTPEEER